MAGRLNCCLQKDYRSEDFGTGILYSLLFGTIFGLIFMIITLFIGFSLKATIIFSIISGVFFYWANTQSIGLYGLLGCGIGSGIVTLIIFCLRAGLKQGFYAGAINLLTIYAVSFCIVFVSIIWDICSDLYYEYRK